MSATPKRRGLSRKTIFTIVRIMFGLGIFALFAACVVAWLGVVLRAAHHSKVLEMANQLQTATLSYYTEYGTYPTPPGVTKDYVLTDSDGAINAPPGSWGPLIECLSGMTRPTDGQSSHETTFTNDRKIAFLSLKPSDVSSNDQPLNPLASNPAAPYFNIAIDADNDGLLGDPKTSPAGLLPDFTRQTLGSPPPMTGSAKAGGAIWANCNPTDTQNSNYWVRTY
jgi:type II secretory pathway pseudopilin PulG